jgi:hypothetical protein
MKEHSESRRLRVVVSDEETGEELAFADGVHTLLLLVAPDTLHDREYRHLLLGDGELSMQLLFDVVNDVTDRIGQGTIVDIADMVDDSLLLEATEGLPVH